MCLVGSCLLTKKEMEMRDLTTVPAGTIIFDPKIGSHSKIGELFYREPFGRWPQDDCYSIEVNWQDACWIDDDESDWETNSNYHMHQSEVETLNKWFLENFGSYNLVLGFLLEATSKARGWNSDPYVGDALRGLIDSDEHNGHILFQNFLNRKNIRQKWLDLWKTKEIDFTYTGGRW